MMTGVLDEGVPATYGAGRGARRMKAKRGEEDRRKLKVPDETPQAGASGTLMGTDLAFFEAHRRELLEAIRTPIVTTTLSGRITGFNAAAIALFGSPARLYGRGIRDVLPFAAEPHEPTSGDVQGRLADATGRTVDLEISRTVLHEGA